MTTPPSDPEVTPSFEDLQALRAKVVGIVTSALSSPYPWDAIVETIDWLRLWHRAAVSERRSFAERSYVRLAFHHLQAVLADMDRAKDGTPAPPRRPQR